MWISSATPLLPKDLLARVRRRREAGARRSFEESGAARRVIAVVSDAIYPYHMGGKEVRYHHVVGGLAGHGLDVHVFTMQWWPGAASREEGGVQYHALCRRYSLYRNHRRSILEAVMFSLACLRLLRYRFDLIEADHMPHLQLFTIRLVAWLRRVPLVVTWHEFWGRAYWKEYLGWPGLLAAEIERACLRLPDAIVTPSPETAARLVAQGVPPARVTVVPNGLDLEAIAGARPGPPFDLVYVGRLVAHKHVELILEAMAGMDAEPPLTCAIVGDGPERPALEATASRLGLDGRVDFLRNLEEQTEIFGLMKAARAFVLPSTREGFGIVVAEAIACGIPVVTTNHKDNHARVLIEEGRTGWLCEPTTTSLTVALEKALTGPALDGPTPEDLDRYAWETSVTSILDVFQQVGGPSRSVPT